jgi:natural resistance-associated macrophage protein
MNSSDSRVVEMVPSSPEGEDAATPPSTLTLNNHLQRLIRFVGPTWLIASTFIDPGALTAALQQGSQTRFALLWVSWWSICFGYVFQILAARIGIVSGHSIGELCVKRYSKPVAYSIWAFIETSVLGNDIQACVGATIALNILTGLPWWSCVLLTVAVSVVLTLMYYWNSTKLELTVGGMLLIMIILVWVNVGNGGFKFVDVLKGWVVPSIPPGTLLTVVGSVGSALTPSALFLGSYMVLDRNVDRSDLNDIRRCVLYIFIELMIGLVAAFVVYLGITVVFANAFYRSDCAAENKAFLFTEGVCGTITLSDGPIALRSLYGAASTYLFAFTLLLSGIASMVTSTLAAQATWESILGTKIEFWKLVVYTRSFVLIPTLTVALAAAQDDVVFTVINDWINVFMSFAMPMAAIPTVDMASSKLFLQDFAIKPVRVAFSLLCVTALIGINFYLLYEFLLDPVGFGSEGDFPAVPGFYAGMAIFVVAYVVLLSYVAYPGLQELWGWFQSKFRPSEHQSQSKVQSFSTVESNLTDPDDAVPSSACTNAADDP